MPTATAGELLTSPGMTMGTVAYMSPEQARGEELDARTDLFSSGAVLYEMATGRMAFPGNTAAIVHEAILNRAPVPVARLKPELPAKLEEVIGKALEKDRRLRYQSAADIRTDLQRLKRDTESGRVARPSTRGPEAGQAPGHAESSARTASRAKIPVVILPFEDLSPRKDNEYFSDGLTEEITADLSNISSFAVVSRTSASSYKATSKDIRTIAGELSVRYVLEGSVRKAGDALRINAQLIDAENDTHLWAGKYKGTLQEVFEIQEEVSRQIVEALRVKLTPAEKEALGKRSTLDAEAFDLYLKGRNLLGAATKKDLREGLSCFEAALARDPRYAAAHAGVAEACAAYYEFYDRNETWLDRAIESALKALVYDADLPEAAAALGLAYFNKGSLEESLISCRRAIELDPVNYVGYWTLGRVYYVTGRTEEAIEPLKKVVELSPEFYPGYFTLRMVCQSLAKEEIYLPYLTRLINDVLPRYLAKHPDDGRARNCYGTELTMAGRCDEGLREVERALLEAPDDPLILYASACYFARFGDRQVAVDLLRRAIAAGYTNIAYIEQDPDMRALRAEKAYRELFRNPHSGGEGP